LIAVIVRRELIHLGRHARLFVWRSFYFVLSLALMAILFYPLKNSPSQASLRAHVSSATLALLKSYVLGQLCLLTFFIPVRTATTLADERKARSLELLTVAGMSMWKLVVGKVLAMFLYFGFFVITTVPALAIVAVFGEANPALPAAIMLFLFEYALFGCAVGTLSGVLFRWPYISALVTTIVLAGALILWLCACGNWLATDIDKAFSGDLWQLVKLMGWFSAALLIPAFLMIGIGAIVLRRARPKKIRRPRKPIPLRDRANPLAWRYRLSRRFSRLRLLIYFCIVLALGSVVAAITRYSGDGFADISLIIAAAEVFVLFMGATVIAATAIAGERESGSLELLLATPLRPRVILNAKLRGIIVRVLPLVAIPMMHTVVACTAKGSSYPQLMWMVAIGLIGCTLRAIFVALAVSAIAPTVRLAIRWSMGLWFLGDIALVAIGFGVLAIEISWGIWPAVGALFLVVAIVWGIARWRKKLIWRILSAGFCALAVVASIAGIVKEIMDINCYYGEGVARLGLLHWVFALAIHAWPYFESWTRANYCIVVTAIGYTLASVAMWIVMRRRADEVFKIDLKGESLRAKKRKTKHTESPTTGPSQGTTVQS